MSIERDPPSVIADAVRPLDYAPPVARSRRTVLIGGIVVSLIYAFGTAMIAMGLMMMAMNRYGNEAPQFVAIGVFAIVLATGVMITLWLARR